MRSARSGLSTWEISNDADQKSIDAYLTKQRSLGMRFESAGQLLRQFSRAMGSSRDRRGNTPRP